MENAKKQVFTTIDPHALKVEAVLADLGSSREGLSASELAARLERNGRNRLPEPPKESLLKRFFKHFHDTLVYILLAGVLVMLQMVFVYAPFMHAWFGSASLLFGHWLIPVGIGQAVFLAVEMEKVLLFRVMRDDS